MRKIIHGSMKNALCMVGLMISVSGVTALAQQENRNVSGFDKIAYSLADDLEIAQGTTETLILKGDPEDLSKIITIVENGELQIYTKNNSGWLGSVHVFVNVRDLKELSVSGSGNVVFKTGLKTSEMEISLSGSGDIECLDLNATETEINLAGSGNIELGGVINGSSEINIAGSGDVNSEKLKVILCEVNISGSGSARVWVSDRLESNINGSGNVSYKGKPLVDAETTGSGNTRPIQ